MTDFARGLWCGAFGASGESNRNEPSAARASVASRCDKAREPRLPAESRRNERRLSEKFESVHIKECVARQQHLAQVSPHADGGLRLASVNEILLFKKAF